ncbi:MAG TPA: 50S ribosomal protein L11 methyltransferase [Hyphomicrobiaceae bacterium]|nr:50S ribosomal protein L11 methyltransferase [Hyphomicrobiaceae bacterium]
MARAEAFIRANTRLLNPPLTPEIRLHLAEESLPIWQKTEDELGEMNVPPPFWAFAWAGGQAVARYILDTPDVAAGRSALDLGAGSGIGAIAAKLSGASDALAADIDRFAVVAASLNAAANGVALRITRDDLLLAPPPEAGLVVVADMFYEKDMAEQVLEFCVASARQGAVVLVGDPQRNYFPRDRFHEVASYSVPVTRELEDSEIKRTAVWRLTD